MTIKLIEKLVITSSAMSVKLVPYSFKVGMLLLLLPGPTVATTLETQYSCDLETPRSKPN